MCNIQMAIQIGSSSLSSEDLKLDSASRFRIVHIQQATIKARAVGSKAPALPRGAVRGCSYLKWRVEGRFFLSPGWSPTPPNSMLNRLSSPRGSPWCFFFFERIRFQDFFYFFVEKTLLLMKNQHFIIIITFHQITHQLVLSIFTWDFIFSSKFSL